MNQNKTVLLFMAGVALFVGLSVGYVLGSWISVTFNAIYFALLAVVLSFLLLYPEFASVGQQRLQHVGLGLFVLGFLLQGYHVVEHVVRMGRFFHLGCTPCPGILGWYVDLVYLHITINTATWLLPLAIIPALWRGLEIPGISRGARGPPWDQILDIFS